MGEDSTRRLLKTFGVAVTNLEEALAAGEADRAKKSAAHLREVMKDIIELVERQSEQAEKL